MKIVNELSYKALIDINCQKKFIYKDDVYVPIQVDAFNGKVILEQEIEDSEMTNTSIVSLEIFMACFWPVDEEAENE